MNTYKSFRSGNGIKGLNDMCRSIPDSNNKVIVEVGSYAGDSAEIFLQHFRAIICIDTWDVAFDSCGNIPLLPGETRPEHVFDRRFRLNKRVLKMKMSGDEAALFFPDESLDVVYIDTQHYYEHVLKDLHTWYPRVKKGGYISGHDYEHVIFPGIIQAVGEILGQPDATFIDTSWIKKRS